MRGFRWVQLSRRSAPVAFVVTVALVVPFVLAIWSHQNQRPAVTLASAQAWLTTRGSGRLALIDGPSATFVTSAAFGRPDADLSVVDRGTAAFAVDPLDHQLLMLDDATERTAIVPTSGSLDGADPLVSGDTLYLHRADNTTASLSPEGSTLVSGPVLPKNSRLAATGGRPAAVDFDAGTVTWFKGTAISGKADGPRTIAPGTLVAGDQETGDVFLLDPQRRTLVACRQRTASCEPPIPLPPGPDALGQPVVAAGRLIAPEPATGNVLMVAAQSTITTAEPFHVFAPGTAFELVEQQGYVFANAPTSITAAVIAPNNSIRFVDKRPVGPTTTSTSRPPTAQPSRSAHPSTTPPKPTRSTPTTYPTRGSPTHTAKPRHTSGRTHTHSPTSSPRPTHKPAPPPGRGSQSR